MEKGTWTQLGDVSLNAVYSEDSSSSILVANGSWDQRGELECLVGGFLGVSLQGNASWQQHGNATFLVSPSLTPYHLGAYTPSGGGR